MTTLTFTSLVEFVALTARAELDSPQSGTFH